MRLRRVMALFIIAALSLCQLSCSQRKGAPKEQESGNEQKNGKGYIIYINAESPQKTVMYSTDVSGKKKEKVYEKNPYGAAGYAEKIAFLSKELNKDILYMMNAGGKELTPVIEGWIIESNSMSWSPDGRRIVFTGGQAVDSSGEIYYVEAGESKTPVKVTDDIYSDESPKFGSNGKTILYAKYKDNNYDIYKYDIGGQSSTNLSNNAASDISPVVSPDGTKIFFLSDEKEKDKYNLYSMNTEGENRTEITTGLNIVRDSIRISPDSSMVAFITKNNKNNKTIHVINMNKATVMIADDAYMSTWSSDSKKLYYATFDPKNRRIVEYDVTGNTMKDAVKIEYKPGQESEGIRFLHYTDSLE